MPSRKRPSAGQRHVALLRGINVGGNNIIPMAALRAHFEAAGFTDVTTYIASGNVLFTAKPSPAHVAKLERSLADAFRYSARVAVISAADLARVVAEAPPGFGSDPKRYRYDVLFVLPPLRPTDVLA